MTPAEITQLSESEKAELLPARWTEVQALEADNAKLEALSLAPKTGSSALLVKPLATQSRRYSGERVSDGTGFLSAADLVAWVKSYHQKGGRTGARGALNDFRGR
jgi:hypothetical protein